MKKLYDEYYRVPKEGLLREKVMLVRMAVSIIIMIVCLVAMSFSAYAFYSYNVSSVDNTILAANFDAEVSVVTIVDSNNVLVTVTPSGTGTYRAPLEAGNEYTVTLRHIGSAQTGFCVVTADGCGAVYHTQQLGMDGDIRTPEIKFTVTVNRSTVLSVLPHWGTSSHYDAYTNKGANEELYILNNETVALVIAPPEGVSDEEDTTTSTTVTTTTTTSSTAETTTDTTVTTQSTVTDTTTTESTTTSAVEETTKEVEPTSTVSTETQVTEEAQETE